MSTANQQPEQRLLWIKNSSVHSTPPNPSRRSFLRGLGIGALYGALSPLLAALPSQAQTPRSTGDPNSERGSQKPAAAWVRSSLLYYGSTPSLPWLRSRRIIVDRNKLVILTDEGVALFFWHGEEEGWRPGPFLELAGAVDAASLGDWVAVLSRDGLHLLHNGGARRRIGELQVPGGSHAAVGSLSGEFFALIGDRAFRVVPGTGAWQRTPASLPNRVRQMAAPPEGSPLYALNGRNLYVFDPSAEQFILWRGRSGQSLTLPADGRTLSFHPSGRWLYVGTAGAGLFTLDLGEGIIYPVDVEVLPELAQAHVWSVAVDTARDVAYIPTWREVIAVGPASDPSRWEFVGTLNPMGEPPLHTFRDVAPGSGAAYLPQSDQLVFGGQQGVCVLSATGTDLLVREENFESFRKPAATLPGKGAYYDRLRAEKLRGIWTDSVGGSGEAIPYYKQANINTVFLNIFFIEHGEFYPPDARQIARRAAAMCQRHGLELFLAGRPYFLNTLAHRAMREKPYRQLILRSGAGGRYARQPSHPDYTRLEFPCYFDETHWELSVRHHLVEIARLSLEVPITGFMYEMGDGFTGTNFDTYEEPCLCDACWRRFMTPHANIDPGTIPAAERYRWLAQQGLWSEYVECQRRRMAALIRETLDEVRSIQPKLVAALALPETTRFYPDHWLYNAWIDGLGTAEMPVIVASEQTYAAPFSPPMAIRPGEVMQAAGQHVIYVPGVATIWLSPAQVAQRTRDLLTYTPGVWYYTGSNWTRSRMLSNHFVPYAARDEREYRLIEYVEALSSVPIGTGVSFSQSGWDERLG